MITRMIHEFASPYRRQMEGSYVDLRPDGTAFRG